MTNKDIMYLQLIEKCRALPYETEWLEYKHNNDNPEMIGEYISALGNSATLCGKENAYIIWGIDDTSHEIIGTDFDPKSAKVGNQELENWLSFMLTPTVDFSFHEINTENGIVVLLEIPHAHTQPIRFKETEFIRNGSYKKKLKEFPEKERKLWQSFETKPYELQIVMDGLDSGQVSELLDMPAYYTLMNQPLPRNIEAMLHDMIDREFLIVNDNGNYAITNMGALLLAKDLHKFINLRRKAIRVIRYKGEARTKAIREEEFKKGYAVAFDDIIRYIMSQIPQEEEIGGGRRIEHIMFPEKAIREMVGNIMIHQDLRIHGMSPMIEIFDTRVEACSPGDMLVDINRIIDTAPHSRNENIASFMRIIHICEERGSGFDRIEEGMCDMMIPAPKVETASDFTRTKLVWRDNLNDWSKDERIRTCYLYVCYCYINGIETTNAILRDRFGIEEKNKSKMTRIINEALESGLINLYDETAGPRLRKYIPYWA